MCAYCLIHEGHFGGLRNFHVDHFRPKKKFPHLTLSYENLYYSCALCNTIKADHWPSEAQFIAGYRFADPCQEDTYEDHFVLDIWGVLRSLTNVGEYTLEHLRLNRRQLVVHRQRQAEVRHKCREARALLDSAAIPPVLAGQIRRKLDEIERSYTDPPIPYEPADLTSEGE